MKYPLAERFKAPQGEGMYAGAPMAFMRMVGCSVGQHVCTACDTDFSGMFTGLGGGLYDPADLVAWAEPYQRACITGGEPLDRDLRPLLKELTRRGITPHIETSGTKHPDWLDPTTDDRNRRPGIHAIGEQFDGPRMSWGWRTMWLTVSPKPGYLPEMIALADEIKVIVGGLGDGPGWPTVDDAVRWAGLGRLVYVQPRNHRNQVDDKALAAVIDLVGQYPQLRLSSQLHKFIKTR